LGHLKSDKTCPIELALCCSARQISVTFKAAAQSGANVQNVALGRIEPTNTRVSVAIGLPVLSRTPTKLAVYSEARAFRLLRAELSMLRLLRFFLDPDLLTFCATHPVPSTFETLPQGPLQFEPAIERESHKVRAGSDLQRRGVQPMPVGIWASAEWPKPNRKTQPHSQEFQGTTRINSIIALSQPSNGLQPPFLKTSSGTKTSTELTAQNPVADAYIQ
jgi:hypothetical protein